MNAGCRIEQRAPLPANEPLLVRAQLAKVDDDGRRALITTSVITGTKSAPDAIVAEIRAYVPLAKANGKGGARSTVPLDAREIAVLIPLVILTILFGFYPSPILDATAASANFVAENFANAIGAAPQAVAAAAGH